MKLKEHDFVELDFVGKIKDTNEIFDLTQESVAKLNNIYNPKFSYKPVAVCIGENNLIKSLENSLIGKEKGKYEIEIKSEDAFGKRNPELLKLVPSKIFKKENLKPFPGLNVNIDGNIGTIRTVSGGRIIIDFNHHLSGKDLIFEIEIKRIITDKKEKLDCLISKISSKYEIKIEENKADIKINLNEKNKNLLKEKILNLIPEIKEVNFNNL